MFSVTGMFFKKRFENSSEINPRTALLRLTGCIRVCHAYYMSNNALKSRRMFTPEAAEFLGTNVHSLQQYYKLWGIPCRKVGRNLVWLEDELWEWLQSKNHINITQEVCEK